MGKGLRFQWYRCHHSISEEFFLFIYFFLCRNFSINIVRWGFHFHRCHTSLAMRLSTPLQASRRGWLLLPTELGWSWVVSELESILAPFATPWPFLIVASRRIGLGPTPSIRLFMSPVLHHPNKQRQWGWPWSGWTFFESIFNSFASQPQVCVQCSFFHDPNDCKQVAGNVRMWVLQLWPKVRQKWMNPGFHFRRILF